MACRIAQQKWIDKIIGVDLVDERLERALAALYTAIETVRRGGTVSLSGAYGGMADPLPMMSLFDKQIQLRMGQGQYEALDRHMPSLTDEDPLGVDDFATHRLPLAEAPAAYEIFQRKADGGVKTMLKPWG